MFVVIVTEVEWRLLMKVAKTGDAAGGELSVTIHTPEHNQLVPYDLYGYGKICQILYDL